jgi:hypothetical protein
MAAAILSPGCMYKLTFPNGKSYIGITKRTAAIRFAEHVKVSRAGKKQCAVHHAILKYGADVVMVETLAVGNWPYLITIEVKAIALFGTRPPHGYNLTRGGEGVVGFDQITRAKMGAANVGRTPVADARAKMSAAGSGRLCSVETRAKMRKPKSLEHRASMSAAQKGRTVSDETREKMRTSHVGKTLSAEHRAKLSRPMPETTRAAISAANTGRKMSDSTRAKLGTTHKGKTVSAETRAKIGAANTGKIRSAETLSKLSAAIKGRQFSAECIAKRWVTRRANNLAKALAAQTPQIK